MKFLRYNLAQIFLFSLLFLLSFFLKLEAQDDLENILKGLKAKYQNASFSVYFEQTSKLKALGMEDSASGAAFFKHPKYMRWEYLQPEEQIISTNGKKLWIYKKEENQLLMGDATEYFKGGKGISFLSNADDLINSFFIELMEVKEKVCILKLVPLKKQANIAEIYIEVTKDLFLITKIISYNSYGDETKISMSNFDFTEKLDAAFFEFTVKGNEDVINIEQQ